MHRGAENGAVISRYKDCICSETALGSGRRLAWYRIIVIFFEKKVCIYHFFFRNLQKSCVLQIDVPWFVLFFVIKMLEICSVNFKKCFIYAF